VTTPLLQSTSAADTQLVGLAYASPIPRRKHSMYRRNQWRIIVPFLLPALILYLLFVIYPDANAFWVSLHSWNGLKTWRYIGLDNYTKMAQDGVFWLALDHNSFFAVVMLIAVTVIALFLAVVLTGKVRFSGFFRTIYFFPVTVSVVAIAAVWKLIFIPIWGPPSVLLSALGTKSPLWLGNENLVLWSLATVMIWGAVGFHMTLYIAGIKNIPITLYEAARIDGANRWQEFRNITFPLLRDVLRISVAFLIIGGLNVFATIRVMMQYEGTSLPKSVQVLATYMYEQSFGQSNYGYGTAIAVILFLLTMIVTLVSLFITRRRYTVEL
jgi:ABC-type sugar transport system permease subunit